MVDQKREVIHKAVTLTCKSKVLLDLRRLKDTLKLAFSLDFNNKDTLEKLNDVPID